MKKKLDYCLLVLSFLGLLTSCSQDVFDEYYARPEGLEPPIYQQLQAGGNFKNLLGLIDKAGYKDILSNAGYWTMLAPNDAAFTKYFQENGIDDVSKINTETATKIVKYALIYNAFQTSRMSDYQSKTGWDVDNAFRRRTAFYDGFQTKNINGLPSIIVNTNRNNGYVTGDSNNKYISYFTKEYFVAKSLTAFDYNLFFPKSTYTGFNVLGGSVDKENIIAENGVIHEVNQVTLPLPSIDQQLEIDAESTNSKYSSFSSLFNFKFGDKAIIEYPSNQIVTTAYYNFTGKTDDVKIKLYNFNLIFAPNNENFLKLEDNDGQKDCFTLFVPDNDAMAKFEKEVLLKKYTSKTQLPIDVIIDFVNSHMVPLTVWPSKIESAKNGLDEDVRFNLTTDLKEAKMLSNGMFYGMNKVQRSNYFYSVYTSAYLDPNYTMANRFLKEMGYRDIISNLDKRHTLFLYSDKVLRDSGYEYDTTRNEWRYILANDKSNYKRAGNDSGTATKSRLIRFFYNAIVPIPNGELDNIASTSGIIRSGDADIPGEYIKWKNNTVYAAGNEVGGTVAKIIDKEVRDNGTTYYLDDLLRFSEESKGASLLKLAPSASSEFYNFYSYLINSTNYLNGNITDVNLGSAYTIIVPNNAAIMQAVRDGVLPGNVTTGVPTFKPTAAADIEKVTDFINYHIITNRTVSDDGLTNDKVATLRKLKVKDIDPADLGSYKVGDDTYITVNSVKNSLSFTSTSRVGTKSTATYIANQSNNFGDNVLIHLVNNYLTYKHK